MKNIVKRPFRILTDFPAVRSFMLRVYTPRWENGVAAPFLEYALSASWADQTLTHRDAIWEEDGRIVAFCFYESRPGTAFFVLAPGYDCLAGAMLNHAEQNLTGRDGKLTLRLIRGQKALLGEAEHRGYVPVDEEDEMLFDLHKPLEYPLPAGFAFVSPENIDTAKVLLCCWKGFNHESEGPWDGDVDVGLRTALAPNATPEYYVVIADTATGEYVCYAGMWWTPENRLAYMEPLCTVPAYRHRGLAAAALSEMARRMRPLGAQWMTGGANAFYRTIGFESGILWFDYEKSPTLR